MTTSPTPAPHNGLAYAGFVFGLISATMAVFFVAISAPAAILLLVVPSVLAIVFSSIGLAQATVRGNKAVAAWGLVLGLTPIPIVVVITFLGSVLFGIDI